MLKIYVFSNYGYSKINRHIFRSCKLKNKYHKITEGINTLNNIFADTHIYL